MKIVIDIPEELYRDFINNICVIIPKYWNEWVASLLKNGTPLPEGAEILTKEAYSDLCTRAADVPDTNVGDLISRLAARNALLNKGQHSKRYKLGETWELNLMEIEETLGSLPSFTPAQKWIPVTDHLPEKNGEYLITWTSTHSMVKSKYGFLGDAEFEDGEWFPDGYIRQYPDVKILAWMELPLPYRGGEEE